MEKVYILLKTGEDMSPEVMGVFYDKELAQQILELENRNFSYEYEVTLEEATFSDEIFRTKLNGKEFYLLHISASKYYDGLKKFPPFDRHSDYSEGVLTRNEAYDKKEETIEANYSEEKYDSYSVSFEMTLLLDDKVSVENLENKNKIILNKIEELFRIKKYSKKQVEEWMKSNKDNLLDYLLSSN